ncbi:hypothetical protein H6P81_002500 [Aristolochia fimbriata]|uniref:Integrase catalytic domain-containing protein n=1 Tax=Aristolochia fimbriata TaxID=158543 RepID=A0AAV7FD53_ARIFI|nr:hypothetical protein H6P81_002500 [Aristolochia fimbriata]
MSCVQCHYCKGFGHMKFTCLKLKKSPSLTTGHSHTPATTASSCAEPQTSSPLTALDAQDMIIKSLSGLGQGTSSASAFSAHSGKSTWIIDSGASSHMSSDLSLFISTSSSASSSFSPIYTADGSQLFVSSVGSACTPSGIRLSDVLYVPNLSLNLISVGQLYDLGFHVLFTSFGCQVQDPTSGKIIGTGRKVGRLFELDALDTLLSPSSCYSFTAHSDSKFVLWHSRLGHVFSHTSLKLVSKGVLGSVSSAPLNCVSCKLGKHTTLPYTSSDTHASAPFDLIHSDVWGPAPISTMGGSAYYVVFIDDFSRFVWVYLLQSRSAFYTAYVEFSTMVHTQFSKSIKNFRSDSRGEYVSHQFRALLKSHETQQQLSCPCTPQQNGVVERKHRHILDTTRALLLSSSVPRAFWGEAVLSSVYIINRLPSLVLNNSTPFAVLYGSSPDYYFLRVFGSTCFVLLPERERDKLFARSAMCVFLGYGLQQKGFRCFDPVANKLRISRNVTFWENTPFYSLPKNASQSDDSRVGVFDLFPDCFVSPSSSVEQAVGSLPATPLSHESSLSTALVPPLDSSSPPSSASSLPVAPSREASSDPLWQKAIAEELNALTKTRTWDLVSLPPGTSVESLSDGRQKCLFEWHHFRGSLYETSTGIFSLTRSGDDLFGISDPKTYLSSCFEMKDLGLLRYFLGLEVLPLSRRYGISQVKYASDLVSRAGLSDNKTSDTPLELNVKFRSSDGELLADPKLYRQLVGGLLYLSITRPDIYAVHVVSQFMAAPRSVHYAAVLRILRYVKGTLLQGLLMSSASPLTLLAFSDADWAGDVTDHRSTTGYSLFLGYSPISWRSKKQSTVSRSSTEAEYRALADTTSELVWLLWLL